MEEEKKVATEVAEAEFERWLSMMGLALKLSTAGMSEDDRASFDKTRAPLIRAIESGLLVVVDEGLQFTPAVGDQTAILFPEPEGDLITGGDKYKDGANGQKMMGILSKWTGKSEARFKRMKWRDFAVCESISALFIAK